MKVDNSGSSVKTLVSGKKLQSCNRTNQCTDKEDPPESSWLLKIDNADNYGTNSTNTRPHGISGTHGQCLRGFI
ncbi:hypothetical protein D3C87_700890 [compost metagenome]